MSQVDEGLVHAWLDGALSADESARIEALVHTDAAWAAAAAEARGLIAHASRVVAALDDGVVGGAGAGAAPVLRVSRGDVPRPEADRVLRFGRRVGAIAAVLLVAVVGRMAWNGGQVDIVPPPVLRDAAPVARGPETSRPAAPAPVATDNVGTPSAAKSARPAGIAAAGPARAADSPLEERSRADVAGAVAPKAVAPATAEAAPAAAPAASRAALGAAAATVATAAPAAAPVAAPAVAAAASGDAGLGALRGDSLERRRQTLLDERLRRRSVALEQVVVTGVESNAAMTKAARPVDWLEERACVRVLILWESDATLPAARAEVLQEVRGLRLDRDTARFEVPMPAQRVDGATVDTRARLALGRSTGQGVAELVRPDGTVARRGQVGTTARCP